MDRDEALKLLRGGPEGIAEWNRLRAAIGAIPSLSGADLRKADLRGADLRRVDLGHAILVNTNLSDCDLSGPSPGEESLFVDSLPGVYVGLTELGTNLRGANLTRAYLARTNLTGANLRVANLRGSNFHEATLRGASLIGAIFINADLKGADFSGAICSGTTFSDIDFSGCKGLETVTHVSPSSVSTDTLIRSRGMIPEAFLRGCGLPDAWIANLPALIGALEPIQFYSCFIRYSHKYYEFAKRLHSRMVQEKLRVWYAPEDMKGGRKILDQLEGAIHVQDKLLLVLSETSMQSGWVETELRTALRRERREGRQILFPIRITSWEPVRDWKCFDADSGRDLAKAVREYHIPDFSNWKDHDAFEAAFAKLLRDLKAENSTGKTK
jgi:hypothetical protein